MPTVTYTAWKQSVATLLDEASGLHPDHIPLVSFPTLFQAGCTPAEAADEALANADTGDAYGLSAFLFDPDSDDLPF